MTEPRTFYQLLDRLTADHPVVVQRDSGTHLMNETGLLQQLREAVFSGMEQTGGTSAFGSKPPMDAAALDLLNEITNQATEALAQVTDRPTPYGHAESYVRLWAGQTVESKMFTISTRATVHAPHDGQPATFDELTQLNAYQLLSRWVDRVDDFFNPPSTREIKAACPACDARHIHRMKDGSYVQSAALNFIRDRETKETTEARCSACGASWSPTQFEWLAQAVGANPLPELDGVSHE